MNILTTSMGLSILILTITQTVSLHRATVCRQEAWLLGTELGTRSLLTSSKIRETAFHSQCQLKITRNKKTIYWHKLTDLVLHHFELEVRGKI